MTGPLTPDHIPGYTLEEKTVDEKWRKWGCYLHREYGKHLWDHIGRCYGCSARRAS